MKVIALIAAAGSGIRMGDKKEEKPFLKLGDVPLLVHVLSFFDDIDIVDEIVLVVKAQFAGRAEELLSKYDIKKKTSIIAGGSTRTESVCNGISSIAAEPDDIILIHDGARPFVTESMVKEAVNTAREEGGAVVGVPCSSTIKNVEGSGIVESTPDRRSLWEAQTPQVFKYHIIKEAYAMADMSDSTDDSVLVERAGHKVRMVMGDTRNIKITTQADLVIAQAILGLKQ